jgi:hypothetical protein
MSVDGVGLKGSGPLKGTIRKGEAARPARRSRAKPSFSICAVTTLVALTSGLALFDLFLLLSGLE